LNSLQRKIIAENEKRYETSKAHFFEVKQKWSFGGSRFENGSAARAKRFLLH